LIEILTTVLSDRIERIGKGIGLVPHLVSQVKTTNQSSIVYAAPTLRDSNLQVETVVTGLALPTSMALIDENDILVLEKNKGTVLRVKNGIIFTQPVSDVNVASNSERGMLGIDVIQVFTPILSPSARLYYGRLYRYSFIDDPRLGPAMGCLVPCYYLIFQFCQGQIMMEER
jgi:hypothetical protein